MRYYSKEYSRLKYEISVWDTANKTSLNVPKMIKNKSLTIITSSDIYTPVSELHRTFEFLNIDNIYE